MAWQSATVQFPPSAQALSDSVAATLTQGRSEVDNALARLGDVQPTFTNNPTAATAQGSATAQSDLENLFGVDLQLLVVHPYLEGVGQGDGYSRHLSAPNAQHALAAKLGDAWDSNAPTGSLDAVAVLFAEQTLQAFADRLQALATVFPVPELRVAERRAEQLLRLESEKSVLPGAPLGGHWHPRRLQQLHTAQQSAQVIAAEIACAYGYELEGTDPVAELQALAAKKQQHLDTVRANTQAVVAAFASSGPTYCLSTSGTPREIASQVEATGPFDHDHVFSAALLFTAAPGNLVILQEVFGL